MPNFILIITLKQGPTGGTGKGGFGSTLDLGSKVFSLEAVSQAWRPQRDQWNHGAWGKPWPSLNQVGICVYALARVSKSQPLQTKRDLCFLSFFIWIWNTFYTWYMLLMENRKCRKPNRSIAVRACSAVRIRHQDVLGMNRKCPKLKYWWDTTLLSLSVSPFL